VATTSYGVNHPLAVKAWSRRLFHEIIGEQWFSKFMGEGTNSVIQIQPETNKSAGDRVRVGLRMLLTGAGIAGDDTLEGNEEALVTFTDDVFIDQLRHATRSNGRMTEQRVHFSLREENRMALRDWWAERLEMWAANQLANNTAQTNVRFTGMQATVTVDANHLIIAGPNGTGSTTEVSISATTVPGTGNYFTLADIDRCVARAKTMSPRIRPVRVNGRDIYLCFLHPYQVYGLRNDTSSTNSWNTLQRSWVEGGKDLMDSPIATGALGYYNQTLLHEWSYVPLGVSSSAVSVSLIRRAIFCGAQAGLMAYGQGTQPNQMSWVEELFDFGNQLGVAAGMIGGLKVAQFNSQNFGSIVVSSYAPPV
jgi:N4-gp56 family major capsid protein